MPNHGSNFSTKIKSLLDKIFVPNVSNRISAEEILNDPWITGMSGKAKPAPKSAKKPKIKKEFSKTTSILAQGPIDDFSDDEHKASDEIS